MLASLPKPLLILSIRVGYEPAMILSVRVDVFRSNTHILISSSKFASFQFSIVAFHFSRVQEICVFCGSEDVAGVGPCLPEAVVSAPVFAAAKTTCAYKIVVLEPIFETVDEACVVCDPI